MLSAHEQKVSDGWVLYYNEDGYPYYYNEETGESEWAEYEDYGEAQNTGYTETGDDDADQDDEEQSEEEDEDEAGSEDEDDEEEADSEEESESDEESKVQREQRIFDKVMEQKFLEYLKTPEGIAAAQIELERVGRKVDKRLAKKSSLVEQEYVRSLRSKKKEKNVPSNTIFGKLMETTNAWMFPPAEDKSVTSNSSGKGSGKHKKGSNGKVDDFNRETKQRHANINTDGTNLAAVEAGTGNRGRQPTRGSPSSSRSSSLSSDTGSFSSEDSDIAEIDAPLFSEVPVSWFSMARLSGLLAAFQTPTVVAADGGSTDAAGLSGVPSRGVASSTALVTTTAGSGAQPFLPESCVVAAEQSFTVLGGAFVQGFGFLFERLNPVLEGFVNSLLDAQATGPPNSRQAQRRQIAAAVSAAGSTSNDTTERSYSNLPPAPPSRAPLSARGPPNSTPRGGVRPSPRTGGSAGPAYSLPTAPLPTSRSRQSTPRSPAPAPHSLMRGIGESPRSGLPPVPPQREVIALPSPPAVEEVSLSVPTTQITDGPGNASSVVDADTILPAEASEEPRVDTQLPPVSPASPLGDTHVQHTTDMPHLDEFSDDPRSSGAAGDLLVLALHSHDEEQEPAREQQKEGEQRREEQDFLLSEDAETGNEALEAAPLALEDTQDFPGFVPAEAQELNLVTQEEPSVEDAVTMSSSVSDDVEAAKNEAQKDGSSHIAPDVAVPDSAVALTADDVQELHLGDGALVESTADSVRDGEPVAQEEENVLNN